MHDAADSYYEATSTGLRLPPLAGEGSEVEVAIIGGGFAGLATARGLQERGLRSLAVLEAGALGQGASGRCGGFVFGGYSRDCAALLRELGPGPARVLYALTRDAVALIRRRIEGLGIACDRTEGGALLLDWFDGAGARAALRRRAQMMREQFGVDWRELSPSEVREAVETDRYGAALLEPDAFHFHPLKYVHGLAAALRAEGASLYERSPVSRIEKLHDGWRVHTAAGASLRTRQLVLAGGATMQGLQRHLERSRLAIATYVMATEPLPPGCEPIRTPAALYDTRFAFDYYRMLPDRRLLWGGRISILVRDPARIAALLRADLLRVYPQLAGLRIDHAWGGLMSYARHQMPQIGQLARGLWFAQAFGGHGVAPTTVAGELLAETIQGGAALPVELARYGLVPVFGRLGLAAAQASYSWAELKDALRKRLSRPA